MKIDIIPLIWNVLLVLPAVVLMSSLPLWRQLLLWIAVAIYFEFAKKWIVK